MKRILLFPYLLILVLSLTTTVQGSECNQLMGGTELGSTGLLANQATNRDPIDAAVEQATQVAKSRVEANTFPDERNFEEYEVGLSGLPLELQNASHLKQTPFGLAISRLTANDTLIDQGAGQLNALQSFAESRLASGLPLPHLIGISPGLNREVPSYGGKLVSYKRYTESFRTGEFQAKVLVDYLAAGIYGADLTQIIEKDLSFLTSDGQAFFMISADSVIDRTQITLNNESTVNLLDFFRMLEQPGLSVQVLKTEAVSKKSEKISTKHVVILTRTGKAASELRIPKLKLIDAIDDGRRSYPMPRRIYIEQSMNPLNPIPIRFERFPKSDVYSDFTERGGETMVEVSADDAGARLKGNLLGVIAENGKRVGFIGIRTPIALKNASDLFVKVEGIRDLKMRAVLTSSNRNLPSIKGELTYQALLIPTDRNDIYTIDLKKLIPTIRGRDLPISDAPVFQANEAISFALEIKLSEQVFNEEKGLDFEFKVFWNESALLQ